MRVAVDQHPVGATATITDVGRMAVQQYDAIYPHVLARAVVRRVVKNGIIYGTKEVVGQDARLAAEPRPGRAGPGLDGRRSGRHPLLGPAARQNSGAPHRAARRRTPDHAPARHVRFGPAGSEEHQVVTIANGRNTYVLANFPDERLVGKILVSQP